MIFNKVSAQERVQFTKSLSVMLKSGIDIDSAFNALSEQVKSKVFKKAIKQIRKDIKSGVSLSTSFGKRKDIFGNIFVGLIKAGESSGTLQENLVFLADWLERNNDLNKKMKSAMLYPKIVLSATFLLGGMLAVYILPKLTPLFGQLRVELPLATKILLAISSFVQQFWFMTLLGIVGVFIFFILINKLESIRRIFHYIYLKIPFIGSLIQEYQLALVSQLFAVLSKGGLSINEMLSITSETVTNIHYQESISKMKERINSGTSLSKAMRGYSYLYPSNVVNIVATGEESGTLDDTFFYLAEFYSKEVQHKTDKLPTIIEPILLIVIALVVGFIALSIIMPIYKLTEGISV